MSLRQIVAILGGDLYQNGLRANVPAPGHGKTDRSVSLLLDGGRVVIHTFGAADWREVRDDLRRLGLVDPGGRLLGVATTPETLVIDHPRRRAVAGALWQDGVGPARTGVVARHLAVRGVVWRGDLDDLREHPRAPFSVYRPGRRAGRAMMTGIRSSSGDLTAVELTYLATNGQLASGLRVPRKTVGQVPPGSAVRLRPAAPRMLVAEGVVTTLSAMERFELPGWALMSAGNLSRWHAPEHVSTVLVAGDRGVAGETAAMRLADRLEREGVEAILAFPPPPFGDWNEAAQDGRKAGKEGRERAP
ncbi:putative DNA primase/helicase [Brevundimonas vesicularis]|uniref:toprim domain-containing protein n=1 Tax=Brevundimonas vesicularis TaxID=41276 RepID=UPI00277D89C4|nr:toprim domain-containing protein [Brevundimonas vesicularis]MDQ1193907.1 putative DNA primase/helicase [Brevundimonas vesicularis]